MKIYRKLVKALRLCVGVPIFGIGWIIFGTGALISLAGFKIAGFEDE